MAKKTASKAVETPRGPANAIIPLTPMTYSVTVRYGESEGIVQGNGSDWFGPLNPMAPVAPPEVEGRRFDYVPGYNLATQPRAFEPIGFPVMRSLAETYDLLRVVLETRKDQIARMNWSFQVGGKDARGRPKQASKGQQSKIDELTKFFIRPDGVNRWRPWLRSWLEDKFVIDAAAFYCQRNRGGKLLALKQVDGSTIKVVLDNWGRTPQPYAKDGKTIWPPAYQQALKGLPAVDYSVRDMIYRPYNKRVHKAYGYSEVEQIIMTVNIALRRQMFQLSYYTEGNVPEAIIGTPDQWTPEQIIAFQNRWDSMLRGNLGQRRHALFVPGGVAKTFIPTKTEPLKDPMDEWLARVVCFAFSVSPQAFVQMMNRATAGTAQETAQEEGVEPLKEYIAEFVNDVAEQEFGVQPGDIVFSFEEESEVDQAKQQDILSKRLEDGAITINEVREDLGLDRFDNPAADMLMAKTPTGYVPVEANTPEAKAEAIANGLAADPTAPKPSPFGAAPPAAGSAPAGEGDQETGGKKQPVPKGKSPPAKKPIKKEHAPHAAMTDRMAKAARRARRLAPVPFEPKAAKKAVARIKRLLHGAFKSIAADVAAEVRRSLPKAEKASRDDAGRIANGTDLSAIDEVVISIGAALADAAASQAERALAQVGPDAPEELMNQVNQAAVEKARQVAAELVGKRWVDGELVDNPDAYYRIDESTRDMIRSIIADGLEDNIGNDAIADMIEDSTAFSEDRAQLVAYTEVRRANSMAAVEGYRGARDDLGVNVKKEWLLGDNPCPICEDNADAGAIDLDDDFPSGDGEPPAHPNCECAVAPVVEDAGSEDEDE